MRHRLSLLAFIVIAAVAIFFLVRGDIGVTVFGALFFSAWAVTYSTAHWGQTSELKFSIFEEDVGLVWKVKERAELVAAKAEEVERLKDEVQSAEQRVRRVTLGFIETVCLDVATRNFIPMPDGAVEEIDRHIDELIKIAIPNPDDERAVWETGLRERVKEFNANPWPKKASPPKQSDFPPDFPIKVTE